MAMRLRISGRVQGVGFRAFTRDAARAQGVTGWVRNLPDGRVEAHLEGAAEDLDALGATLRRGPAAGRVDDIASETVAREGCDDFDIRR